MRQASKIGSKMKNDIPAENKSVDIAAAVWYNIEVIFIAVRKGGLLYEDHHCQKERCGSKT
jgi:hypothetical protein